MAKTYPAAVAALMLLPLAACSREEAAPQDTTAEVPAAAVAPAAETLPPMPAKTDQPPQPAPAPADRY